MSFPLRCIDKQTLGYITHEASTLSRVRFSVRQFAAAKIMRARCAYCCSLRWRLVRCSNPFCSFLLRMTVVARFGIPLFPFVFSSHSITELLLPRWTSRCLRGMSTGNTECSLAKNKVATYEIPAYSLILSMPLLSRKQNGTKRSLSRCLFLNGCPK